MKYILFLLCITVFGCCIHDPSANELIQPDLYKIEAHSCDEGWSYIKTIMISKNLPNVTIVDMVVDEGKCKYLVWLKK